MQQGPALPGAKIGRQKSESDNYIKISESSTRKGKTILSLIPGRYVAHPPYEVMPLPHFLGEEIIFSVTSLLKPRCSLKQRSPNLQGSFLFLMSR